MVVVNGLEIAGSPLRGSRRTRLAANTAEVLPGQCCLSRYILKML
jgi:NAD(P)H-dependent FMN reductase